MKIAQTALVLALGTSFVFADSLVPTKLSYQGRVSDSSGTLIGATQAVNRTVYFKLYTVSTGGTPVWAESQTVTISSGEFSVLIGNGTGISSFAGPSAPANTPYKTLADIINSASTSSLYLGVTVDDGNSTTTDVEISPRQQFVSGAFALRATVAESVASSGITASMIASGVVGTDALGTLAVTTAKVAASAITADKIGDSAVTVGKLATNSVTSAKIDTTTVGLWTPYGTTGVYRSTGNVGIGIATPTIPLQFAASLGDKISLFGGTGDHYGFGIQGSLLQIHTSGVGEDVAFGWGSSSSFNEKVRIKGSGFVGIGTSAPGFPLNFASAYGDKISLYGLTGNHFGLGVVSGALQIHTDVSTSDIVFGHGTSSSFTERVRIKGTGSVGIGTNAPLGPLHIYEATGSVTNDSYGSITLQHGNTGGASTIIFASKNNAGSDYGYIQYRDDSSIGGSGESSRLYIGTQNDTDDHLILNPSGYVGIKTSNPTAPLHVAGEGYNASSWDAYMDYTGPKDITATSRTDGFGVIVDSRVRASCFVVQSDKRLKKGIQRSDSVSDLASLLKIEVSDYQFVDSVRSGSQRQKKVIAQQVESFYPQAITKSKGAIPDIYKAAEIHDGWVHLETDLKLGDKVRLLGPKNEDPVEVLEVAPGKFRTNFSQKSGKVFVFGREVDDLRGVDYEALFMLNVSATQEIHKQLEAERSETAALRRKLSDLESSLGARLEALEKASKATK